MTVKCVVWDLDNTVWDGVLLEDGDVRLRPGVVDVLETLDRRGILHSVASRNDHDAAIAKLRELGLDEYFLYPQINWDAKSRSVAEVARALNIGVDTLAFVDDQAFERDEVRFVNAQVRCIDAADLHDIPGLPEMNPAFVTDDSARRRQMYRADAQRRKSEEEHDGSMEEFLASLGMEFSIRPAGEDDLARAEELTVRTNQLNATGYTYSYAELDEFRRSDDHDLLVAELIDKYGSYGVIGITLVHRTPGARMIKLLLMSCRVMSRGVGAVLLNHLISEAATEGDELRAEFVPTPRNRTMYVTDKFAGFREESQIDGVILLRNDFSSVQGFPPYMKVTVTGEETGRK